MRNIVKMNYSRNNESIIHSKQQTSGIIKKGNMYYRSSVILTLGVEYLRLRVSCNSCCKIASTRSVFHSHVFSLEVGNLK